MYNSWSVKLYSTLVRGTQYTVLIVRNRTWDRLETGWLVFIVLNSPPWVQTIMDNGPLSTLPRSVLSSVSPSCWCGYCNLHGAYCRTASRLPSHRVSPRAVGSKLCDDQPAWSSCQAAVHTPRLCEDGALGSSRGPSQTFCVPWCSWISFAWGCSLDRRSKSSSQPTRWPGQESEQRMQLRGCMQKFQKQKLNKD